MVCGYVHSLLVSLTVRSKRLLQMTGLDIIVSIQKVHWSLILSMLFGAVKFNKIRLLLSFEWDIYLLQRCSRILYLE